MQEQIMLITGFEPFDNPHNSSWEAVKTLPNNIKGVKIEKLQIPVVFDKAPSKVIEIAEQLHATYIIMVGQAGSRKIITPELVAKHQRRGTDAEGHYYNETLNENDNLNSNVNITKIVEKMKLEGFNIEVSNDAGTYVCNDCFYKVAKYYNKTKVLYDFVHVPCYLGQIEQPDIDAMSLKDITKHLERFIELFIDAKRIN